MNLAYVSLAALVVAILVSCFTELNVGILALALAWIVGVYVGGMPLNDVIGGFPVSLFLTLVRRDAALRAGAAEPHARSHRASRGARVPRQRRADPDHVFRARLRVRVDAAPGNVSTAALLGPMAMAVAGRAAIPAFLMIIMVGNGAQAGALSPFAPTGVIVNGLMEKIGLAGPRVVYLLDEPRRACRGRVRRIRALRRTQALQVERVGHDRAQAGRHRVRPEQPHDDGRHRARC